MSAHWSTLSTFLGPFTVVVDNEGAVLASGWTDDPTLLLPLVAPSLRPRNPVHSHDVGEVGRAVRSYHEGEPHAVEPITVRQRAGEFTQHAWEVLRKVEAGEPISYARYAELAGRPEAVRAAASACARNPAALFVPCHRVLRGDGSLGGFRWGTDIKRRLLEHERSAA